MSDEHGMTFFEKTTGDLGALTPEDEKRIAEFKKAGMAEETKGLPLVMARIKMLHAAQLFQFDDQTTMPAFNAVILHVEPQRAWWKYKYGTPESKAGDGWPDCYSRDLYKPEADARIKQSDACGKCPHDKFGSDVLADGSVGRGKACKEVRRLFSLVEGHMAPHWMAIPPTSLKPLRTYFNGLQDKKIARPQCVITRFGIVKAQNQGGVDYSELSLSLVKELPPAWVNAVIQMKDDIEGLLRTAAPITQGEFMEG